MATGKMPFGNYSGLRYLATFYHNKFCRGNGVTASKLVVLCSLHNCWNHTIQTVSACSPTIQMLKILWWCGIGQGGTLWRCSETYANQRGYENEVPEVCNIHCLHPQHGWTYGSIHKQKLDNVQGKLKIWYQHCIKYIWTYNWTYA
jgi:hypothetical protein